MVVPARGHRGGARPTTLSGALSNSALSFTVTSGGGAGHPDGSDGAFLECLDPGLAGEEKVLCLSRSGDTFTVDPSGRGYDGTVASAHANLAVVTHTYSAIEADEANKHITDATRDDHTQYSWFRKSLAAVRGAAGRSGKLHLGIDSGLLAVDDGTTWHEFQDKASADAAYGISAWTTYTPSTSGLTLGNGTISGAYRLVGKTLNMRVRLTWGSTSVPGSSDWTVGLPASLTAQGDQVGTAGYRKVASQLHRGTAVLPDASGAMFLYFADGQFDAAAYLPSAPATGDSFIVTATFEVR